MISWPPKILMKFLPTFTLQGDALEYVTSFKYLGFLLCSDLKDDIDIRRRTMNMYAIGNMIIRKFKKCNLTCKYLMFKTYCSSVYCSALWDNYRVGSLSKLKVAHNDILRSLLGVPRYTSASALFVNNRLDNLEVILRKSMYSLMSRLRGSGNRLVGALLRSEALTHSRLWHHWTVALRGHENSYYF